MSALEKIKNLQAQIAFEDSNLVTMRRDIKNRETWVGIVETVQSQRRDELYKLLREELLRELEQFLYPEGTVERGDLDIQGSERLLGKYYQHPEQFGPEDLQTVQDALEKAKARLH